MEDNKVVAGTEWAKTPGTTGGKMIPTAIIRSGTATVLGTTARAGVAQTAISTRAGRTTALELATSKATLVGLSAEAEATTEWCHMATIKVSSFNFHCPQDWILIFHSSRRDFKQEAVTDATKVSKDPQFYNVSSRAFSFNYPRKFIAKVVDLHRRSVSNRACLQCSPQFVSFYRFSRIIFPYNQSIKKYSLKVLKILRARETDKQRAKEDEVRQSRK